MTRMTLWTQARTAAAMLFIAAGSASAQLSNVSTAATGLGGAFTARGQGYNAVYWNPANLAMPGNPGFSLTIAGFDGNSGLRPIDFADISQSPISRELREQWLLDVNTEGTQRGDAMGAVTSLGLSLGRIGFQVASKSVTSMDLSPDATEMILFGNFGRDSAFKVIDMTGSRFRSAAYTTAAMSYGMPFRLIPLPNFSLGATAKYIIGHGLVIGRDNSSVIDSTLHVNFPSVITRGIAGSDDATEEEFDLAGGGKGFGLDLGAAWTIPGFRFGVSVQNIVNTFRFDTTAMETRQADVILSYTETPSDDPVVKQPFGTAPADLREEAATLRFKPVLAAGMAFDWFPGITVSADVRQQVGGGIEVGPESLLAAGAEVRWLPFLPLRGGVQMMSGGFGVSGGVGLRLFGFEAGIAGFVRTREGSQESGATINVVSIRP